MQKKGLALSLFLVLIIFTVLFFSRVAIGSETSAEVSVDFNYCPITINDSSMLTADVTATASCVLFGADNIVLDCNGKKITWNTAGGNNAFAVWADNRTNVTVKNCILVDSNVASVRAIGINFTRTNSSFAQNNTILTNGTTNNYGINIQTSAHKNFIHSNTIFTNGTSSNYGIYLSGSSTGNALFNNIIYTDGTSSNNYGVYIDTSDSNNVTNNSITTNGTNTNRGISIFNSNLNNITANLINSNGTEDQNHGIYLSSAGQTNITYNNVSTVGGFGGNYGIYLSSSEGNNVSGNRVRTDTRGATFGSNYGVGVSFSASNNVTWNDIITNGTGNGNVGVIVDSASPNTNVSNNRILTNGTNSNYGIYLVGAATTDVVATNNNIFTNGTGGDNYGIYLTSSRRVSIFGNNITTNGTSNNWGIAVLALAYSNLFANNTILTNGTLSHGIYIDSIVYNLTFFNTSIRVINESSTAINSSGINITHMFTFVNDSNFFFNSTNASNNTFYNTSFSTPSGIVYFLNFSMEGGILVTKSQLNVTNNTAFVNSSNVSALNTSAQITLYGITALDPRPLVDLDGSGTFIACPASQCTEISYSGGVYVFNVTKFSTYSSNESALSAAAAINETTLVASNFSAAANAFNLTGSSMTLNCLGKVVTYGTGGSGTGASAVGQNNVSLANCAFISGSSNSFGLNFTNATNVTATNLTLRAGSNAFALVVQNATANLTNVTFNNSANWITTSSNGTVNLTNVTFRTENGTIRFPGTINLNGNFTITQAQINITNRTIFVNSTNLTAFNTTAQVTLFNLTEVNPTLLISTDDVTFTNCSSPTCVLVSYSGGTAVFNVTQFSTYRLSEATFNLSFSKDDSADPVYIGTNITYTINITINGTNATNVTVIETYPSGITFLTSQPSPVSGSSNRNFSLGNLTNTTFEINITVNASVAGTALNIVNITFLNSTNHTLNYTTNETTTIQELPITAGGSGGSGGGGGGGSSTSQHQAQTTTMTATAATYHLQKGDKVAFTIANEQHTMTLLALTQRIATIRLESTPQEHTLTPGKNVNADVNNDGNNDVNIKLQGIDNTGAHITISKIQTTTPATQPFKPNLGTPQTTPEQTTETAQPTIQTPNTPLTPPTETPTPPTLRDNRKTTIIIALLVFLAIALFVKTTFFGKPKQPTQHHLTQPPNHHTQTKHKK